MWIDQTYHARIPPVFQPQTKTRECVFWQQEIWILIRGVRVSEFESLSLLEWRSRPCVGELIQVSWLLVLVYNRVTDFCVSARLKRVD